MHFFDIKGDAQHRILLEVLPDVEEILELFIEVSNRKDFAELKAAREAEIARKKAEALAKAKPEDAELASAVTIAEAEALKLFQAAADVEAVRGIELSKYFINELLKTKYELAKRVIAAFYGVTSETLAEDNDIFDMLDMALAIISHEKVLRFFPQLRRWAAKMQPVTLSSPAPSQSEPLPTISLPSTNENATN